MNEIANIIDQLETQKGAIEQAVEALRDFGETGRLRPGKSTTKAPARKGGMTPQGRRRRALAMKRRRAANRTGAQAEKKAA